MQIPQRFLTTQHRRRRLVLWALTMLTWVGAALFAGQHINWRQLRQRCWRFSLSRITDKVICLMIVRAGELARRRVRRAAPVYGRRVHPRHFFRSLLGSRLRRVLKHKDAATRIANLIAVLRNMDAYAQQLVARLKRGLTRLCAIRPTRQARALRSISAIIAAFVAPAPSPAFSDSS